MKHRLLETRLCMKCRVNHTESDRLHCTECEAKRCNDCGQFNIGRLRDSGYTLCDLCFIYSQRTK